MSVNIIGGGLAGCICASILDNAVIYEKNEIGGLCRDNENYQDFVHILHTDNKEVWDYINKYTTVRPHTTYLGMYVNGQILPYPPEQMSDYLFDKAYNGYSQKMWQAPIPPEAKKRIITEPDGRIFHNKYEGVPAFTKLFKNLTKGKNIVKKDIRDGDLEGPIILTGAIDEYFNYCYGELPYRGMQATHYESETGLPVDFLTFSDENIPYQRLIDYKRLGYKGQWIGVENACKAKHYPVRTKESEEIYNKYLKLAQEKNISLCGRLATYHYLNMDEVIEQCFDLVNDRGDSWQNV